MNPAQPHGEVVIHEFTSGDYSGVAEIHNSVFPGMPVAGDYYVEQDQLRDAKIRHRRWLATVDGQAIGTGLHTQDLMKYHPRKFDLWVIVRPEHQGLGIGRRLYNTVVAALDPFKPITLRTQTREDHATAIGMLERRGFAERFRGGESTLTVAHADLTPLPGLMEKLRAAGVEIKTLHELAPDSDRNHKLHELYWDVSRDIAEAVEDTPIDLDAFVNHEIEASTRLRDGFFVAVDGAEYVGMCVLIAYPGDSNLWHGLTGVKRGHRRRGIARALKLRAIEYARRHGYPAIKTGNEVNNRSILALNQDLGFVPDLQWIYFEKTLREEV